MAVFAVAVPAVVLGGLHVWAERQGRGPWLRDLLLEDVTVHVVEPLLEREGDGWATTLYAEINSPIGELGAPSGDRARVVTLGGSFMFGDPYGAPGIKPRPGGIPSWLSERLGDRGEVLNLAGMGDASSRVAAKVAALGPVAPDAFVIATGNNEYPVAAPSPLRRTLRQHALARRMALWFGETRDRTMQRDVAALYAVGPPEREIRARFVANVEAAVDAAGGTPVLLATVPNNLWWSLMDEGGGGLRPDVAACAGPLAAELEARPDGAPAAFVGRLLAADASVGCAAGVLAAWRDGRFSDALAAAAACDAGVELLGVVGAALAGAGRTDDARPLLQIAAEARPLLIRPSFNEELRRIAAAHEHVHLVDLDAHAQRDGLPGPELFVDVCHLNWAGYRAMADELAVALLEAGVVDRLDPAPSGPELDLDPLDAASIELDRGAPWGCPPAIPAP